MDGWGREEKRGFGLNEGFGKGKDLFFYPDPDIQIKISNIYLVFVCLFVL